MGKRPFYRKVRQTLHETVSDSGKSILCYRGNNDKIYYVASSNDPNVERGMIEVTWQELKNKRDAGELTPGSLYRITDYQCTTTQENTKSAGHQFDIVLLALSENKLAEEGWAMHHANDTYFANSNLSAWKVWYCLDNDTERFAWAQEAKNEITGIKTGINPSLFKRDNSVDTVVSGTTYYGWKQDGSSYWTYTTTETPKVGDSTWAKSGPPGQFIPMQNPDVSYVDELEQPEGKGVIYRLIDEWNNDVPYDFKNILIYNETYSQYCYAIIDNTENNFNEDPTLNGTKVKAIHVLCDNNDELKPIAKGGFGNNPLVNIIFLNNNTLTDEYSNCVVSNGLPIVS